MQTNSGLVWTPDPTTGIQAMSIPKFHARLNVQAICI